MSNIESIMKQAVNGFHTGRHSQAVALSRKVLSLNSQHTGALGLLGVVYAMHGRLSEAVEVLGRAVAVEPQNPALVKNLAKTLMLAGRAEEGLEYYARVASLMPGDSEAQHDLACAYLKTGNMHAAASRFRQALSINPDNAGAHVNLGKLLRDRGQHREAIRHYEMALKLVPDMQAALVNLGLAEQELGNLEQARQILDRATELYPGDADAHFNRALCLLLDGDHRQGWTEFEWRWKRSSKQQRGFPFPLWDGSPLDGRTVLVYAEQGIGDEVMFASCLPDLLQMNGQVILECEPRLAPLFARSFKKAIVHGRRANEAIAWLNPLPKPDIQTPIGSLPRHLRQKADAFPDRAAYLIADPDQTSELRRRLAQLGPEPKVGISWKGGGTLLTQSTRSIDLGQWRDVLSVPSVHFINVQHGQCARELADVRAQWRTTIHDLPGIDPLIELDNFSALISALDLVISVDNSTVHLAGALGTPAWLLLPPVPDWRWAKAGSSTLWYRSLRLFRRPAGESWRSVLNEVAARLSEISTKEP
jgi:Flp pilus assembly protein TadD